MVETSNIDLSMDNIDDLSEASKYNRVEKLGKFSIIPKEEMVRKSITQAKLPW